MALNCLSENNLSAVLMGLLDFLGKKKQEDGAEKKEAKAEEKEEEAAGESASEAKYDGKDCSMCGKGGAEKKWMGQYWHKKCLRSLKKSSRKMI